MSRESEERLSADGLSRNLGGDWAEEHGYGSREEYSDGTKKHINDDDFHVHPKAGSAAAEEEANDPSPEKKAENDGVDVDADPEDDFDVDTEDPAV